MTSCMFSELVYVCNRDFQLARQLTNQLTSPQGLRWTLHNPRSRPVELAAQPPPALQAHDPSSTNGMAGCKARVPDFASSFCIFYPT